MATGGGLARGTSGEVPAEVRFVRADRDCADAYDLITAEHWEAVLTSSPD